MQERITDEQFLEYVAKAILDNPDGVKVRRSLDAKGVLLNLEVSPEDMGQIIGREGMTIQAVRLLTKIVGLKNGCRTAVIVDEPEKRDSDTEVRDFWKGREEERK